MDFKSIFSKILILILLPIVTFSQVRQFEDNIIDNYRGSENLIPASKDSKYITDENGILRMYIEVWGQINRPGTHLVYEGIDLISFFSVCGGPTQGANLSRVKILRQNDDSPDLTVQTVNLKKILKTGENNNILLEPNDVILVDEKFSYRFFNNLNILNTSLHILTLYFQIEFYRTRID